MSFRSRWAVPLVAALLAAFSSQACSSEEAPRLVDRQVAAYIEDEPGGRALAEVETRLSAAGGSARLELLLSADGAEVEPVPGFAGVRGHNRITARELTRLVREQRVVVRTSERDGGTSGECALRVARVGHVPERRVAADGSVELDVATREEFVLALHSVSDALAPGRYRTEVLVGAVPRLAVDFWFDGRAGRIERIDSHPVPVTEELGP
jgi:hypothetical protein